MVNIYLIPSWFFGYQSFSYDAIIELAFAIITLIVSIYAFKVYKLSQQRQSKLFGIAFSFISASYFIWSIINFNILERAEDTIPTYINVSNINALITIGVYIHILLFMTGLITFTYMTLKFKSAKTYSLLLLITLISLFFSSNVLYLFYVLSSILLIYVVIHYFRNYIEHKQAKTLLVLIAFILILFGSIHFLFSVNHAIYYIISHFLELIAYLLILTNLILVIKK